MPLGYGGRVTLTPLLLLLLLLLLLVVDPGEACGRGSIRGSGRRRRPRRLTPLVFKQHVPNVSENTLGASGLEDGRIKRGDAKFKDLARNNNADILFKDEEGTGADRIMSQRCKQKLNTLAISVLNQWPGVKLRVTEAWDEDNMHAENSLHYEGRAVDITTSDRDKSKYGMLARLAVEAGFDWVYYESRGHIHCSVKSDSSVAIKIGGCFSPDSQIVLSSGQTMSIADLQVGHRVLAMNSRGQLVYSDVIGFLDRSANHMSQFHTLTTETGHSITLTAKHLIYTQDNSTVSSSPSSELPPYSSLTLKFAEDVKIGDYIIVVKQTQIHALGAHASKEYASPRLQRVVSVRVRSVEGYYAPLTNEGTIVVDGVVASCYAFLNNDPLTHGLFAPMRAVYAVETFVSDWWELIVSKYRWLEPLAAPFVSPFLNTPDVVERSRNVTLNDGYVQHEGAHWYARFLYKVAVNVVGMDLLISM